MLHALRADAAQLVLFCDEGAGVAARLASHFAMPIEVRAVVGDTSVAAQPDPLPVVPPPPVGVEDLLAQLRTHGLEVVAEEGSWRGELLGLEIARLVLWPTETGGDGEYHLEAGVGRFDRDAAAAMHEGETPEAGLQRAVRIVSERRHRGATTHPLSLLSRSRWLRSDAAADPAVVGAVSLESVQTAYPPDSVREDPPAAAIATDADGSQFVVVFGAGAGLDLVPVAADTRAMYAPDGRLLLVVPPKDHLRVTGELAAQLTGDVGIVDLEPGWA
ncbi:MAG: hypothetical protein GY812_00535 [Actinomycetia bacterium]|nr:hypothetical protein [Actinomycetes bacterium]